MTLDLEVCYSSYKTETSYSNLRGSSLEVSRALKRTHLMSAQHLLQLLSIHQDLTQQEAQPTGQVKTPPKHKASARITRSMTSLSAHNPTVEAFLPGCRRWPIKDHRNQLPSKGLAGESPDFSFMITHYIVSLGCSFSFCQALTISIFISSSELFQEQMVLSALPYTFF